MSARYFALLTNIGVAKITNAAALGIKLNITEMAVGDGGGSLPSPTPDQTALVNERRRAPINRLSIDPLNDAQIIVEQVIPENVGGWWIKEVGLYDEDGDLVALSNCPETYKPHLQEGSGRTQIVRMVIIVSNTSSVTVKIDPAVVLATRQYVDDRVMEVINAENGSYSKIIEALSRPDAEKLIGRCENVDELRATEPTQPDQVIALASYHGGWAAQLSVSHGAGNFWHDASDSTTPDNGGSVFVTTLGARWKSLKIEFVPEDFGALGGDEDTDTDALQRLFNAHVKIGSAKGNYLLKNFNRPSSGFESWMTYNYVINIDGFKGFADFSEATFSLPEGVGRITAITITNSTGEIHLPKIRGNMQGTIMPSGYIDDCAVRIGAGCKFLRIVSDGIDHYPGHGIVVRHYIEDGVPSLDDGIPYDIEIIAKNMRHCWQSGVVPITGDTIRIKNFDIQFSGSLQNANGRAATVGHNVHFEPVAGAGGKDNRLRNIWVLYGNGFNARMHGMMCHTAIDNFNIIGNNFKFNAGDGARFEGAAHKIRSQGNTYSNNGIRGVTFNCGSLTAAGFPSNQHDAKFDDTFEFNGDDGFTDLSGSKGLVVSGSIGKNGGNGIIGQENGEHNLIDLVIYDNGRGSSVRKHGISGGKTFFSNVRISNSDPSIYNQRPFIFRNRCKAGPIITDQSSYDFDVKDEHPAYFPENDGSLRLLGDTGRIMGRKMYINNHGVGAWYMPDNYDFISIGFNTVADMIFPNPSEYNQLTAFTLKITAGVGYVKVREGTVNGGSQFQALAGYTYTMQYTSNTNLQVTAS